MQVNLVPRQQRPPGFDATGRGTDGRRYGAVVDHLTAEVVDFLSTGTRTGKVAWTAADGRPLVAPVWFVVEDGAVLFNTGKETAKGRAIRRDPRLVLCVDLEEPPYAFVQVQGMATISEDPDELLRSATAIGGRYMGADRAEAFGRRNGVPGELLVRLQPTKVITVFDMTT
jgi:PPOX class probable F420-dependent enzyme